MSSKYPTIAFNARDVSQLMEAITPHADGLSIRVKLLPTPKDSLRLQVLVWCYRKATLAEQSDRIERVGYVSGNGQNSLDRVIFDLLWCVVNELDQPVSLWGTYTKLCDLPAPKK